MYWLQEVAFLGCFDVLSCVVLTELLDSRLKFSHHHFQGHSHKKKFVWGNVPGQIIFPYIKGVYDDAKKWNKY